MEREETITLRNLWDQISAFDSELECIKVQTDGTKETTKQVEHHLKVKVKPFSTTFIYVSNAQDGCLSSCQGTASSKVENLELVTLNDLNLPQFDSLKLDLLDSTGLFKLSNPSFTRLKGELLQTSILYGQYNGSLVEIRTTVNSQSIVQTSISSKLDLELQLSS